MGNFPACMAPRVQRSICADFGKHESNNAFSWSCIPKLTNISTCVAIRRSLHIEHKRQKGNYSGIFFSRVFVHLQQFKNKFGHVLWYLLFSWLIPSLKRRSTRLHACRTKRRQRHDVLLQNWPMRHKEIFEDMPLRWGTVKPFFVFFFVFSFLPFYLLHTVCCNTKFFGWWLMFLFNYYMRCIPSPFQLLLFYHVCCIFHY